MTKYQLISAIRRLGLLKLADQVNFTTSVLQDRASNRRFLAERPDFPVPPAHLAFDAYNSVQWRGYAEGGERHARVFADLIERYAPPGPLKVLEWGCGPGRIIRHLPRLIGERLTRLVGCDYNPASIAWCQSHLAGIEFEPNTAMPPLPFPDNSFDATYNFSVFTHLSEAAQKAWAGELLRVLKPGGSLICTTHGDHYLYLLTTAEELAAYRSGAAVVQDQYGEGKKWFFAFHPERFVREDLLAGFDHVERETAPPEADLFQDIWIGRKPA